MYVLGVNVALKQLRSHRDGALTVPMVLITMCYHTEMASMDTVYNTPSHHSIQAWGRHVAVLFIDIKRNSESSNYHFLISMDPA